MKPRTLVLLALIVAAGCKADKAPAPPETRVYTRKTFSVDPAACNIARIERALAKQRLDQCRKENPVEFTRCDAANAEWSDYKHRAETDCAPHTDITRVLPRKTSS